MRKTKFSESQIVAILKEGAKPGCRRQRCLYDGRKFRTLNVIDEANREALAFEVGQSIPSRLLIRTIDRLVEWYGAPKAIQMDNGPEMSSHDFVEWAARKGITLNYIEPGELNQNAYIERFNRTYSTEILGAHLFSSIEHAREVTEHWLGVYNEYRPHDSLGKKPPRVSMPRLKTPAFYRNQLPT